MCELGQFQTIVHGGEMKGKGACTNDVSREGEGGGYPNSDSRRGRLRDLYSKNSDKGGRGSKIPKI